MDRLRRQFLAGAGLALDQHGGRRFRKQHDRLPHRFHRRRVAAQIVHAVLGAQGVGDRMGAATADSSCVKRAISSASSNACRIDAAE